MTSNAPRLGFLGVGWIGLNRLLALAEAGAAEIVAVAEPNDEHFERCAAAVPKVVRVNSLPALLDLNLDGLVIATPSALHAEQSIAALSAGCAVFCQKPLGRSAEEVRQIIEAARRADRLLGVDLSYRHTAGLQAIRKLVRAGELGEVYGVNLLFHNAYGPQAAWFYDAQLSGGGCVIDLGIHLIDAALWILNSPIEHVSSEVFSGGRRLAAAAGHEVEDFAMAQLRFASGAAGQLACSWRSHAGTDAVIAAEFYGTQGGAALRNVAGSFLDFRAERFRGTQSETLAEPPDAWGGRAIVAWARSLRESPAYDPEIERQVEVAAALDAIYGRAHPASPLASSFS